MSEHEPMLLFAKHDADNNDNKKGSRDLKGAARTIFVAVALPCVPILVIVAVLLGLILSNRVDLGDGYTELQDPSNKANISLYRQMKDYGGGPVIYVRFSATSLTTLASWTSRLLPYLTGSIMAMVAFLAARRIARLSKQTSVSGLPSPAQFSLLVDLLGGDSFQPLYSTIMYRHQTKKILVAPIPAAFWSLLTLTAFGLIIPLVDTWFGVATVAVECQSVHKSTPSELYSMGYKFNASGACINGANLNASSYWPCSIAIQDDNTVTFPDAKAALALQYGEYGWSKIGWYTDSKYNDWYYYDYMPRDFGSYAIDYQAYAPAISTQCEPMTRKCNSSRTKDGAYRCAPGFTAHLNAAFPSSLNTCEDTNTCGEVNVGFPFDNTKLGIGFSPTSALATKPPSISEPIEHRAFLSQNPQYFGTWAIDYPDNYTLQSSKLGQDPEIQVSDDGVVWFLNCSVTVANVTYTKYNNTIISFDTVMLKDFDLATLFTAPFGLFPHNQVISSSMIRMATLAAASASPLDMNSLAFDYASEFSKTALALAAGSFVPANNTLQQKRVPEGVLTRLPLIPFCLLISLKLLYVFVVIGLGLAAYLFTEPAETEVIQQQLSTKAVMAAYFNDPAILQKNAVESIQGLSDHTEKIEEKGNQGTQVTTSVVVKEDDDVRVGLKQDAQGVWKHVLLVNGVWQSILPLAKLAIPK